MRILHLTKEQYKTSTWSGGTTTELFIWPLGADYAAREFSFRVSSAAVELAESDFTPLYQVERWITPLSGGFTLTHPGKPPVKMAPLDGPYRFSGEEATHCVGQATDFNLMLKGVAGEMTIAQGEAVIKPGCNCFYAMDEAVFQLDIAHRMAAGDLLVVFAQQEATIKLGSEPVIVCRVENVQWENL